MDTVRILHCADLHFDTPFSGLTQNMAEQRKEDLRETFGAIINIVKRDNIQILLIAGDLFDNDSVSRMTIDYIINKFNEISNTHIFISPGNHDPFTDASYYSILDWPKNVHIFDGTLGKVKIHEINTCVYGVGFSNKYETDPLLKKYLDSQLLQIEDKMINILLMHGEIITSTHGSNYNPICIKELEKTNMDYVALGHTHEYSGIKKAGTVIWSYPGTPEGRGFDETGIKGIVLGEVGRGFCNLKFEGVCKREYFQKNINISNLTTYEEIADAICIETSDSNPLTNLYKIILNGFIPKYFSLNLNVIKEKLKYNFYFIKLIDDTKYNVDYSSLEKEFSLKGIFVKKMKEKISLTDDPDESNKLWHALKIGLQSIDMGEIEIE